MPRTIAFLASFVVLISPTVSASAQWRDIENERPPVHPPLVLESPSPQSSATAEGGDIGMEVLGGVIGFALPASLYLVSLSAGFEEGAWVLAAAPFTVTAGIYLGGQNTGGHGSFGWTFLGQAIGGAASAPIAFGLLLATIETDEHCGGDNPCSGRDLAVEVGWTLGILAAATLSIGGGVLAYELSDDGEPPVSLAFTPNPTGASLDVSGRF